MIDTSTLAVFWYYDTKFYGVEEPIQSKNAVAYGDYIQLDFNHFDIWNKYKSLMGITSPFIEYTDVPRGRILFHIPTHHSIVIGSDKIVKDIKVQDELLHWYKLPRNTEFRGDEHYNDSVELNEDIITPEWINEYKEYVTDVMVKKYNIDPEDSRRRAILAWNIMNPDNKFKL